MARRCSAGAHDRYKALRSVFYQQINGVILVHELTRPRCGTSVPRTVTSGPADAASATTGRESGAYAHPRSTAKRISAEQLDSHYIVYVHVEVLQSSLNPKPELHPPPGLTLSKWQLQYSHHAS